METKKYEFLDALRGIAIIMVLLVHLSYAWIPINSDISHIWVFWVSLFFMISSYTLSLSQSQKKYNTINSKEFFIRRFFRIYPLYFLIITFIFIAKWILDYYWFNDLTNAWASLDILNIVSHYFFFFWLFPSTINGVGVGEWSLFSEIVFYSGFLYIFSIISQSLKKIAIFIILCLLVYIVWWLLFWVLNNLSIEHYFFFSPVNHFIDFSLWFLLFHLHKKYENDWKMIISTDKLSLLFITSTIACITFYELGIHTHIIWLIPFFLLILGMFYGKWSFTILSNSIILQYLGKISYSIYLTNIFILLLLWKVTNIHRTVIGVMSLTFIIWLSSITYYIELKWIKYGKEVIKYMK